VQIWAIDVQVTACDRLQKAKMNAISLGYDGAANWLFTDIDLFGQDKAAWRGGLVKA
jgi:hypothetical protein